MKYIIILFSLVAILFSCERISQNVQNEFKEMNDSLVDSISYYNNLNNKLFSEIMSKEIKSEQISSLLGFCPLISMHNQHINSVITYISENRTSIEDRSICYDYLKQNELGIAIKNNSVYIMNLMSNEKEKLYLEESLINSISPNSENSKIAESNWIEEQFKNVPANACIQILNKWNLENNLVSNAILNKVKLMSE